MGQIAHVRKYIPACAVIARPITDLLKAGREEVRWTEACAEARNKLCEILAKRLQLITPMEGKDFHLYVDADGRGMSVVVC